MKLKCNQTYGRDTLHTQYSETDFAPDNGVENEVVNLYPEMQYQVTEGFGGAITDAAGSVFARMSREQQERLLDQYFNSEAMNYQMVRIPIDSCDFSTHMFAADDEEDDREFAHFSFRDVERNILPLLDAVERKLGRKAPIMLTPWSPPAYMKTNHSRKEGGSLKKEYYEAWAKYLCRYIREYLHRGYLVKRISIQNEAKAVQVWDSCVYTPEEEKVFLRDFLYPEMKRQKLDDIEIFIWDHNKERAFERACAIIDKETEPMIAGVAVHWYSGDHFDAVSLIREKFPDKKVIHSESCLEYGKMEGRNAYEGAAWIVHDMIGSLNHGICGFYDWNILLDENGGPFHAGAPCIAPYMYSDTKKELTETFLIPYYRHITHYIREGAVRIANTVYTDELEVTSWKNPDGTLAVILLNRTDKELPYVVRLNGQTAEGVSRAYSITSNLITGE